MIYPTRRAIYLLLAGAPMALALGLIRPELWLVAPGWIGVIIAINPPCREAVGRGTAAKRWWRGRDGSANTPPSAASPLPPPHACGTGRIW